MNSQIINPCLLNLDQTIFRKKFNSLNSQQKKLILNKEKVINDSKFTIKILDYISLSKILSPFSVVILHTNSAFWSFNIINYKKYWISSNIIESVFYFPVPFFVLCIGATLLDFNERYGLKEYYCKRITKVILPLIYWNMLLYFFRVYIIRNMDKGKMSFLYLWNVYYGHQIYLIFGSFHGFLLLYMIIPLLAYVEKSQKIKIYSYCFITLMITQVLIPYLISLFQPNLIWVYNIKVGDIIYVFAGYIIHNYSFKKELKLIIHFLGIAGLLIHIFGTQILTIRYKKIIHLHKGYLNLPCLMYSCSLFLFIKEHSYLLFKIVNRKIINKIGSLTIGPFFMHVPIMQVYNKIFTINTFGLTYRLFGGVFICVICVICLLITNLLKKIPFIKCLVP